MLPQGWVAPEMSRIGHCSRDRWSLRPGSRGRIRHMPSCPDSPTSTVEPRRWSSAWPLEPVPIRCQPWVRLGFWPMPDVYAPSVGGGPRWMGAWKARSVNRAEALSRQRSTLIPGPSSPSDLRPPGTQSHATPRRTRPRPRAPRWIARGRANDRNVAARDLGGDGAPCRPDKGSAPPCGWTRS